MKSIWLSVSFSVVEKLVVSLAVVMGGLVLTPMAAAQTAVTTGLTQSIPLDCPSGKKRKGYNTKRIDGKEFLEADCEEDCDASAKPVQEAEKEMSKACTDAGKSANCVVEITKCKSAKIRDSSTDPSSISALMPMLGQSLGVDASALTSALGGGNDNKHPAGTCSDMSRRDYFDQKERIERELKQNTSDITDLNTQITEAKETLDKKMADAQKEINQAQKELNEKQSSISKEKREKAASITEQQSKTAQEIRSLNTQMMDLRSKAAQTDAAYAERLATYTQTTQKLACLADVKEKRAKLMSNNYSSIGSSIGQSNDLQALFDECMAKFKREVLRASNERESAMSKIAQEISNVQATIDDRNNALSSYTTQMAEANKELEKQVTDETQNVIKQMSAAQTDLKNAQDTMTQKQSGLKAKQTKLNARTTELGLELYNMGPVPSSGAQSGWRTADAAVSKYIGELNTFRNNGACCKTEGDDETSTASSSGAKYKKYCESKRISDDYEAAVKKRDRNNSSGAPTPGGR